MASKRRRDPSPQRIARMVEAGRLCGLDVAGFEVSADGAIRVLEARAMTTQPAVAATNDFDRFADQL